jgi:hypothetical protein
MTLGVANDRRTVIPAYFQAVAGQSYAIAVYATNSELASGRILQQLEFVPQATNDSILEATDLKDTYAFVERVSLAGSEWEEDEPDGPVSEANLAWWKWTAPADGNVFIPVPVWKSNDHAPQVRVYAGESPDVREEVSLRHSVQSTTRTSSFSAITGTQYFISVGRVRGSSSGGRSWNDDPNEPFDFSLALMPLPVNDDFANPIDLGNGRIVEMCFSNIGATVEKDEPVIRGVRSQHSLWWTWTAPESIDVLVKAGGYAGRIGVFVGSSLGTLEVVETGTISGDERAFKAVAGTEYRLIYSRRTQGAASIRIEPSGVFPNDHFDDAIDLGLTISADSTVNGRAVVSDSRNAGGALWWEWTAPAIGVYDVRVVTDDERRSFLLYSGDREDSMKLVATRSVYGPGSVLRAFEAEEGKTYRISQNIRGPLEGDRTISVAIRPAADPYDDWLARYPELSDEQRDPAANLSGDGINNLVKFVLGLNPMVNSRNPSDDPHHHHLPVARLYESQGAFAFHKSEVFFEYRIAAEDLASGSRGTYRHQAEVSTDGTTWSEWPDSGFPFSPDLSDGNLVRWRLERTMPLALFRLKVERVDK